MANTSGKKGKRGRGQPPFEPNEAQRSLVKMMVAAGRSQEAMCRLIINPKSNKPISVETLLKAFPREIEIGRDELLVQLDSNLLTQAKKGSLGHQIWFEKTRLGIMDPERVQPTKTDAANATIKHEIEIVGGLPRGSRPDKPEGDDYSDIPPPESHA